MWEFSYTTKRGEVIICGLCPKCFQWAWVPVEEHHRCFPWKEDA